ncbi:MAG: hypothetical protein US75_C0012G0005 [Candidatus Woesebacteria bacterium GW2011_GWC1_38_13]|uniref:KANL3/Tex30 alpha/beta hydrolase-like domain-containing protein n=2 Tax=Candidatus Woeseibacteriota TaxID=1752722 RepID=A0A0G0NDD7_9BACT|nr:MAG: hypothetical protein US75_C0012G0005 [Candidatus Woesebacteria bacterium GW2011_GWC1_38_13]KKQ83919.1 MAG: hypothetical protein UT06_C0013G0019 [Candidatus Woesebacteria bacterium GW2011_GWA1_38_8]
MTSMKGFPNFEYYFIKGSKTLDIILQGADVGIDKPFIRKVINTCRKSGNSVLAFNFLYYERGEDHSSGEELLEELETLKSLMVYVRAEEYRHIRFVGKSLGGIVGSFFLNDLPENDMQRYSIVILGYVTGSVRLNQFSGKISIIQGEKDKFGSIEKVKEDLINARSKNISYFEVKEADHSFRNPETKEPVFVDEAMQLLASIK